MWDERKNSLQNFCNVSFQKSSPLKQLTPGTLDVRYLELQTWLRLWTFSIIVKNYCDLWWGGEGLGYKYSLKVVPILDLSIFFSLYIQFMCNLVFSTEGCE